MFTWYKQLQKLPMIFILLISKLNIRAENNSIVFETLNYL